MALNEQELTGRVRTHVIDVSCPPCVLHPQAATAFIALREAAAEAGLDVTPVSAFRDFETQQRIWNEKFRGLRPLYDRAGIRLERAQLSDDQAIEAILHWSALPGGSRHHWGTEIDVFDQRSLSLGQRPQLLPAEYAPTGPFARLTEWLDSNIGRFGFFRPYLTDRGGVAPEPWHLSYAPVSGPALEQISDSLLASAISHSEVEGKGLLLKRLSEIRERYILNVDAA